MDKTNIEFQGFLYIFSVFEAKIIKEFLHNLVNYFKICKNIMSSDESE